jgi:hypothetical protein
VEVFGKKAFKSLPIDSTDARKSYVIYVDPLQHFYHFCFPTSHETVFMGQDDHIQDDNIDAEHYQILKFGNDMLTLPQNQYLLLKKYERNVLTECLRKP